ncbi:non-ribosomal peptide synthetase [Streptomyces sp. IMTB 2501]|uniref:non-ribosomal peptide synthetase n=1 Tax=Streptomyces sp. IMTB 2501 TaxID=1776340 RepID=UPI0015BA1CBA|nr:non-ribosomal peptide synthetase [Streptomyces sp. IMTB 2501]
MPDLFRRRVAQAPDRTALIDAHRQVTYEELDRVSDAWADQLIHLGVRQGDFVALSLPRRIELVAAMLGVLKAGAAYSALDPAWPVDHVTRLTTRLAPSAIVTWADTLTVCGAGAVLALREDALSTALAGPAATPRYIQLADDHPFCVFFTSGTTGEPKGSISTHRALARVVAQEGRTWFGQDTVIPAAAPAAWDAFALELWGALLNGGTSVLCESSYLLPDTLRTLVERRGVNSLWLTSSLFNLLVDEDETKDCFRGIHLVLTGGERMSSTHARAFLARYPEIRLINGYGPVESTVFATTHAVTAEDVQGGDVPIGRPVADTDVLVLKDGTPCEPGEVGEIYLGGGGLSLGYANNPEATSNAFLEARIDGVSYRLYRTGDLGWWSTTGNLHYAGRADRQVKIRGHRVEPALVEQAVSNALGGQNCHVLPVPAPDGSYGALAAFVVGEPRTCLEALPHVLTKTMPHHLVPQHVIAVDQTPLTANGKLDQKALLDLLPATAWTKSEPMPGQGTAGGISEIFAEVLGERFRSNDHPLFSMGGTSLEAVRICARIHALFGTAVPVGLFLQHSSVKQACALVENALAEELPGSSESTVKPSGPVPLVPVQAEAWLEGMVAPDPASGNCLMDWHISGSIDVTALQAALRDLHQRHEPLRCAYTFLDQPVAEIEAGAPAPEVQVRSASGQPDKDNEWFLDLLRRPFDIEAGEVWRVAVLPGPNITRLGISVDHTAFDGWSEALLMDDLTIAYRARRAGRVPVFAHPAPTFAALWQEHNQSAGGGVGDSCRAFWRGALQNVQALDFPAVSVPDAAGPEPVETLIQRPAVEACGRLADRQGVTLFTVMLALYSEAVARVTASQDFAVGIPVAHRGTALSAVAVGCLTGTVCVPVSRSQGSVAEAVARTGHTLRQVLSHSELSLPEVTQLSGHRRGDRSALFQTVFALQDNRRPVLELDGCAVELHRPTARGAVAELAAEVWPSPNRAGEATLRLTYDPTAVPRNTVLDIAAAFDALVNEVTEHA